MSEDLSVSAQKVQSTLAKLGLSAKIRELPDSTRTAVEAAQAIGCEVAQIAKSLVFRTKQSHKPVLVIASGVNRVNEKKIAGLVGEAIERPDADFVREVTGFAIGGIPPVGHTMPLETLLDEDLWQYSQIWAAGGTPRAIFELTPDELGRVTGGQRINIK